MSIWWILLVLFGVPAIVCTTCALGTTVWDARMREAHRREFHPTRTSLEHVYRRGNPDHAHRLACAYESEMCERRRMRVIAFGSEWALERQGNRLIVDETGRRA